MKTVYRFSISRIWTLGALITGLTLGLGNVGNIYAADEIQNVAESTNGIGNLASSPIDDKSAISETTAFTMDEAASASAGDDMDSDPWEGFNETMFNFNRNIVDRYVLKPVATAWDFILPDPVQKGIHNVIDNFGVARRVINNALQLKFLGSVKEVARFGINSTLGVGGLFDMARDGFGIEQSDEDTGQTLGVWGVGPGPYLVLPLLPPLTVRDGVGYVLDIAMTPHIYFAPWYAMVAGTTTNIINERSLNLDRFERVAESTVDLYSAVRNAYLQRRAAAIKQ
jgi:phospholipid-binding lipoprotein MlaA